MNTYFNIKGKEEIFNNDKKYASKINKLHNNIHSFCSSLISDPTINTEITDQVRKRNPNLKDDYSKLLNEFEKASNEYINGCVSMTLFMLNEKHTS